MKKNKEFVVTNNLKSIKEIETLSQRLGESLYVLVENFEGELIVFNTPRKEVDK